MDLSSGRLSLSLLLHPFLLPSCSACYKRLYCEAETLNLPESFRGVIEILMLSRNLLPAVVALLFAFRLHGDALKIQLLV